MYHVKLQYFDRYGNYLGTGDTMSPGVNPSALRSLISEADTKLFCGQRPGYIYVLPEHGNPTFIDVGGHHDSNRLHGRFF